MSESDPKLAGTHPTQKPPFVETSRRWILLGMFLGTAIGVLPPILPKPVGPILTWACWGIFVGSAIPMLFLRAILKLKDGHKIWLGLCGIGALVGGAVGGVIGIADQPLPEAAIAGTCTVGFLAGYAIVEVLLRLRDNARRKKIEFDAQFQFRPPDGDMAGQPRRSDT